PETSIPGASTIAGIGYVSGVRCLVWVDDSGIKAGAYTKASSQVAMSLQDIAMRQKLPVVHLVESAGANLMDFTVENWVAAGSVFRNLAHLSAAGIPTVTVLHGASTAGGAYMPGMSDYVIGVKENGLAALGGAALVKAATGEVADERELGGAEMHAEVSGLVEYLAEDDAHGIQLAREVVGRLNWHNGVKPMPQREFQEPVHSPDELIDIVPVDYRVPYDVREVLARIVDGADFQEFKSRYGPATVCVQANIMGHGVGIIGNNGPIDPAGATKAAQFFQLCDQSNTPIIFLHNTTGYIVGTKSEQAGMIKHGSKMVQAVSNVKVPRIAMYIGASFGAGNYGMCGFGFNPDFCFAWPNAVTNVMGGDSAAKTMTQVAEAKAERSGKPVDQQALKEQEEKIIAHFAQQENIFYAAGRLLTHAVIDPRDSRNVLGFALDTCIEARKRTVRPNSFGVARL
ncbi:MAG: acyl-CoA carboxylase subunit beta, partial [Pseudomonadales bacterium]|nr:acyl-CoA carboxylase subunit beta [Pseudomonadales bacterium]